MLDLSERDEHCRIVAPPGHILLRQQRPKTQSLGTPGWAHSRDKTSRKPALSCSLTTRTRRIAWPCLSASPQPDLDNDMNTQNVAIDQRRLYAQKNCF